MERSRWRILNPWRRHRMSPLLHSLLSDRPHLLWRTVGESWPKSSQFPRWKRTKWMYVDGQIGFMNSITSSLSLSTCFGRLPMMECRRREMMCWRPSCEVSYVCHLFDWVGFVLMHSEELWMARRRRRWNGGGFGCWYKRESLQYPSSASMFCWFFMGTGRETIMDVMGVDWIQLTKVKCDLL